MNRKIVWFALGKLFQANAGIMLFPLFVALLDELNRVRSLMREDFRQIPLIHGMNLQYEIWGFIGAIALSFFLGRFLLRASGDTRELQHVREGFAIVTFGWIFMAALGAIPFAVYFYLTQGAPGYGDLFLSFTNAYFETMSGLTTTGSTILSDIEVLPRSLLFWRSTTHWLGGMGIITLALAIFPVLGISGYQMFRGEVPGPTAERLQPRLAETAKILWGVYALLTLVEALLLIFGGMSVFDSICHAFGTLATGGFSTRNASIAAYDSAYIQWVITIFMYLAGVNFLIHFQVLRGHFGDLRSNEEFRAYTLIVLAAILLTTAMLWFGGLGDYDVARRQYRHAPETESVFHERYVAEGKKVTSLEGALRHSAFQVLAITTTTGFATCDFDLWPNLIRFLLVVLMFMGGCAGSTGGGIKVVRLVVTTKTIFRELKLILQPRLITSLKMDGHVIDGKSIVNILVFVITFVMIFSAASFVMTWFVPDLKTAFTSVAATLCNIGPGLCGVGAVENFGWIPLGGKWLLAFCMLVGRLEVFTVIVFLMPSTWKN